MKSKRTIVNKIAWYWVYLIPLKYLELDISPMYLYFIRRAIKCSWTWMERQCFFNRRLSQSNEPQGLHPPKAEVWTRKVRLKGSTNTELTVKSSFNVCLGKLAITGSNSAIDRSTQISSDKSVFNPTRVERWLKGGAPWNFVCEEWISRNIRADNRKVCCNRHIERFWVSRKAAMLSVGRQ